MNFIRFTTYALLSVLLLTVGCIRPIGRSPLLASEGWNFFLDGDPAKLDQAIQTDFQNYEKSLPPRERSGILFRRLFVDKTGRHAVAIEIALNGTNWTHVLIYDSQNRRIKVVKYVSGHYMS